MNAPAVATRRYSLRLASKASVCGDNQSVISVLSSRRSSRLMGRTDSTVQIRRSARLAAQPRVCYAGMDSDQEVDA